jgi:hypothetical protein
VFIPQPIKPPHVDRPSTKDWLKGTVTELDDGRTPDSGLRASGNMILTQDGTTRPRPSLVRYGAQATGTILGEVAEFRKASATPGAVDEYWQATLQNHSGTTKVYVRKDGGTWTVCDGKTYDNTALAHFFQVDNKLMVLNGVDNLSYLDIPTLAIIPWVALAAQGVTSAVATAIAGAGFTYYYQVSANSTVGETAASVATSVAVTKLRDVWASGDYVTVTWPANANAVAGVTTYNVYLAVQNPAGGGTATLIASAVNGLTFKDEGATAAPQNVNVPAPLGDTTAGPKCTRGTVINGQVFLVGDKDNPTYIRYGGTGTSVLDFSPFNGGGWEEIAKGTKEIPVVVKAFRDGRGNPQITVLCQGTNGTGKRYLMNPQTATLGTTIISFFDVVEDNGQDGTDSPDGAVIYRDSIWYPSRDGFKTTGTKPQLQNILSTDTVSETILTDVRNLNPAVMGQCVGLAFQGRLYWALPNGSATNNEIWVLDLNREGAWMKPWSIAASWMMLYNDNDGLTHHIILQNNIMYELTYAALTSDDGIPFSTNLTSGLIKFSEDGMEWAKVIDITFVLLRPQGTINFTISGKTEDADIVALGSAAYISTTNSTVAGWSEAGWGGSPDLAVPTIFGWSNFSAVPTTFGLARDELTVEIDEEVENLSWQIDTPFANTDYSLSNVSIQKVNVGIKTGN